MVLLHLHSDHLTVKKGLRLSAVLLLQSTFLAAVMLLVLPRINPLWSVPLHSDQATTGVSDSMSPGDISGLLRNNALAFRVTTDKAALANWRERTGYKEAEAITKAASSRGSQMHNYLESFLLGRENLSFFDLNNFTKMSLILFMILGKIEIIAVIYLIRRVIFRD